MKKLFLLLAVTIFLLLQFWVFRSNKTDIFAQVEKDYDSISVNLTKGVSADTIAKVLEINSILSEPGDLNLVSTFLEQKLNEEESLSTLFDLNKRTWQIPSSKIDSSNAVLYKEKLAHSKELLGIDSVYMSLDSKQLDSEATISSSHSGVIKVCITEKVEDAGLFESSTRVCPDVVVRLSKQYIDEHNISQRLSLKYLKTDEDGCVVFKGLDPNLSYSVLPIKNGFEYGSAKGTIGGNLASYDAELTCSFTQQEHKIKLFEVSTLRDIKEKRIFTVRTPQEFQNTMLIYIAVFFAAWWGLYLLAKLRKRNIDEIILSVLMMLTGWCLLTMFSLNDPLTDKLLGVDMTKGVLGGIAIIALLQFFDVKKFYQDSLKVKFDLPLEIFKWFFKPFKQKVIKQTQLLVDDSANVFKKSWALFVIVLCLPFLILDVVKLTSLYNKVSKLIDSLPKGSGYLLVALCLTFLLFTPLGVAVGGMKVNLNVGFLFQPSEIAKYLIVIFMAGFFSINADRIVQFSAKGNTHLFASKIRMLTLIIFGLGGLMGLYLVLGDMGPSLVIAFTFILMYSIIKSKIDLSNLPLEEQLRKIFTSDFAMLIYGIVSFLIFLLIGRSMNSMGLFCLLWFVLWILLGIIKKQVFETPVLFNLIVAAFIFGSTILGIVPGLDSVAERLDSRNEMCTNTWGTLPIDGNEENPGENTQVAEGLWGLASGGFWGQGIGKGSPTSIPAFHTDMILESIGEQMGFVSILLIILLLAVLLRRSIVIGFRTANPFAFYLCLGISIVTAVQFIIISLGSTGIIPLTGVTVPFFSFGKVSMILNLMAFGLILSISSHNLPAETVEKREAVMLAEKDIDMYNYSVSLLCWVFCAIVFFISSVFFKYQFIDRDDILIKPVFVHNTNGVPVVQYNPRIAKVSEKILAGNILDRNGWVLATSDSTMTYARLDNFQWIKNDKSIINFVKKYNVTMNGGHQSRYYPFQEHLSFMLGDLNTTLQSFRNEHKGYMAEERHLSELRGYDNRAGNDGEKMQKITLTTNTYRVDKWHNATRTFVTEQQLYNYEALLPYLKDGDLAGQIEAQKKENELNPKNIQLTIDAKLQVMLQCELAKYISQTANLKNKNLLRASVVVLNATNGELLASANYPLPDKERLKFVEDSKQSYYSDNNKDASWKAYTDCDLGLFNYTEPGSTAKILSGMAAMRKMGVSAANKVYSVNEKERIYVPKRGSAEPSGDQVDMKLAYRKSSNCYFINLLNDTEAYHEMADIYGACGVSIYNEIPYSLDYHDASFEWRSKIIKNQDPCVQKYRDYIANRTKTGYKKMNDGSFFPEWSWAWGQRDFKASPLVMARAVSTIINGGKMPKTKYVMTDEATEYVELIDQASANKLVEYLKYTANGDGKRDLGHDKFKDWNIGGKTGTPERGHLPKTMNDAWYVCFIDGEEIFGKSKTDPLAIAVRIERTIDGTSTQAVAMTKNVVLPVLKELGLYSGKQ